VVPKLAEWDSIFISSDNGDGRLTAESLVPKLLPRQHPVRWARARCRSICGGAKLQKFYALGSTTPGGTTACRSSSRRRSKARRVPGQDLRADRTKDYSPYITKIRQSGADAVFLVLQGDDNNAFLSQAQQYRLPEKVKR